MKRLFAVLMAMLMLSFAACGGNTSPSESTAPVESATPSSSAPNDTAEGQYVQGASDTEIIVANSAATSGALAVVGVPFLAGIEAYFEMVNSGGGIDGRQINFLHYTDDEADPVKGKAALEGMVEDEKVFAIVGHFGTPVVSATVEDLKAYGIPAVYFATGIDQLYATGATTNEEGYNLFPVQPLYATEGRLLLAYATGMFEAAKVGVIYTNDDAGIDLLKGIEEQAADLGGLEVVAEQVTAGAADVSAAVTSIKNAEVDFIIVASIQSTFPTIVKELANQGVNKDCITTYVNTDIAMSEAIIADITGKFEVYSTSWVDTTAADDMALYAEWIPEDYAANGYAMAGWIAGATFCAGLDRLEGKDITWESYMAALEEAPVQLPFGAACDYAGGNRWGTQAMSLSRAVPVTEETPLGWELAAPMTNLSDLG